MPQRLQSIFGVKECIRSYTRIEMPQKLQCLFDVKGSDKELQRLRCLKDYRVLFVCNRVTRIEMPQRLQSLFAVRESEKELQGLRCLNDYRAHPSGGLGVQWWGRNGRSIIISLYCWGKIPLEFALEILFLHTEFLKKTDMAFIYCLCECY